LGKSGASLASTFTAPAQDVLRKPAPVPAAGLAAPIGRRSEQKRKCKSYTR
jgi:hypothetical protein